MKSRRIRISSIVLKVFLAVLIVVEIYPIFWILTSSLKTQSEFVTQPSYTLPSSFQYENYVDAWTAGKMGVYFKNTIITTAGALLLTIAVALAAGFAITFMRWKLKNAALTFIITGMMIPVQATLIPIFLVYKELGLINTLTGLTLVYAATNVPLAVFLLSTYMKQFPMELVEAAIVDGCGIYQTFARIIVPVSTNLIVAVLTLEFFYSWNDLMFSMTFNSKADLKTIQIRILGNTGFIGIIVSHPLVINIGILRFFSRIRGTVRRCYGGHPNRQTGSTLSYWRQRAR